MHSHQAFKTQLEKLLAMAAELPEPTRQQLKAVANAAASALEDVIEQCNAGLDAASARTRESASQLALAHAKLDQMEAADREPDQ